MPDDDDRTVVEPFPEPPTPTLRQTAAELAAYERGQERIFRAFRLALLAGGTNPAAVPYLERRLRAFAGEMP